MEEYIRCHGDGVQHALTGEQKCIHWYESQEIRLARKGPRALHIPAGTSTDCEYGGR